MLMIKYIYNYNLIFLQEKDWGVCDKTCPMRKYLDNKDINDHLQYLSNQHPNLASMFVLGWSVNGENITGIRLTSGANEPRRFLKPMVSLIGNMHGNEVVGREVLVHLATVLVQGMDYDDRIRTIMENTEIHIVPTMNPDGWRRSEEGDCGGQDYYSGRLNEHRIDLNRNFPVENLSRKQSFKLDMEPETQAIVSWLTSNYFVLGANLHGGAVVASYPWDHYPGHPFDKLEEHQTLDDQLFKHIALEYADNNPAMSNKSSCLKYAWLGSTTNGAKWYPKNGTLKDFSYQQTNSLDFVLELSCCKYLRSYFLPREWDNNRESLLRFIEAANTGVKGEVVDASGKAISGALVGVTDLEGGWAGKNVTSSDLGEYWRLLLPGQYQLQAWHSCAAIGQPINVSVSANKVTVINLKLMQKIC